MAIGFTTALSSCKKDEEPDNETKIVVPEGALPHLFSVSPTKKVFFAKGNLQYQASTNTWRFAENQWDTIGSANRNRSDTYDGWIDLFSYGTSGYQGAMPYNFYNSQSWNTYEEIPNIDISGTNYDWGIYNPISNAGNKAGLWRSLTYDEIIYMLFQRSFLGYSFGLGTLEFPDETEMAGAFIFPDDSEEKSEMYMNNCIKMSVSKLNESGSIFLPFDGNMEFGSYDNRFSIYYFGSAREETYISPRRIRPVDLEFQYDYLWPPQGEGRDYGCVRLVCDYEKPNNK